MWFKKSANAIELSSALAMIAMLQSELDKTKALLADASSELARVRMEAAEIEAGRSGRMQALVDEMARVNENYISLRVQTDLFRRQQFEINRDLQQKLYAANSELYRLKHTGYDELGY